jgi:hypothetical protein
MSDQSVAGHLHTQDNTRNIHALSGIRTHDASVLATKAHASDRAAVTDH